MRVDRPILGERLAEGGCRSANAICSSVNRFRFILISLLTETEILRDSLTLGMDQGGKIMKRRRFKADEIVNKLRETDVPITQGRTVPQGL